MKHRWLSFVSLSLKLKSLYRQVEHVKDYYEGMLLLFSLKLANLFEVSTDYPLSRTDKLALTQQDKDEEAVRKLRNIWES